MSDEDLKETVLDRWTGVFKKLADSDKAGVYGPEDAARDAALVESVAAQMKAYGGCLPIDIKDSAYGAYQAALRLLDAYREALGDLFFTPEPDMDSTPAEVKAYNAIRQRARALLAATEVKRG